MPKGQSIKEDADLLDDLAQKTSKSWQVNLLCKLCHDIFDSSTGRPTAHQQSTLQLKESAYQGCHLCSLFYGCLPLVRPDCLPSTKVSVDGPWEAQISPKPSDTGVSGFEIVLYVTEKRNQSYQLRVNGTKSEISTNPTHVTDFTGADPTIAIAKDWLKECVVSHAPTCEELSSRNTRIIPTRLLRISDDPCIVQLVTKYQPTTRYLILSYCWGKEKSDEMKLTKATEHDLHIMVPSSKLPATVRDAVTTTKKLGYQYLWVDRLCIIQGDDTDWKFEASRMGEYYRNADCCIAALSAHDSDQGLFTQRNPLMMQALKLEHVQHWDTAWIFPSFGRHIPGDYPRLYRGPPYPLSRRAWTLQERLLSPRTLYFGSIMIYWECRKARRSEDIPTKDLDLPFAAVLRKFGSRTGHSSSERVDPVETIADEDLFHTPENEIEMNKFEERWADLVEFYTACEMRRPQSDRLVAISGMMSSITAETRQQFKYGLLVSRFATELLWWQWCDCFGDATKLPVRAAKETNTPTWSWGSVTGRISPFRSSRYLKLNRRDPWRIEADCALTDSGNNASMAPATQGSDVVCTITFTTPLLEACICSRIDLRHYNWKAEAVAQVQNGWLIFEAQIWPDEPVQEHMAIWLLLMASLDTGNGSRNRYAGLAVVPLDANQMTGLWKRIGYFEMDDLNLSSTVSERQRDQASRNLGIIQVRCIKLI